MIAKEILDQGDIPELLASYVKRLMDADIAKPNAKFEAVYQGDSWIILNGKKIDPRSMLPDVKSFIIQSAYDLERVDEFITSLGTEEERNKEWLTKNVAKLIDEAKDLGIEVKFINPLMEMMKDLSENIIEHKPLTEGEATAQRELDASENKL